MIYGYMLESKKPVQQTSIDSIINEEFSTFNRICDSINILTENGIIFEADGEGFFAKIKKIWDNFKKWFNEKVIGFFKELWGKIVNSKLGQTIARIKSKRSEKLKNAEFSTDPSKSAAEETSDIGESVVLEASREAQLKKIVEKNICPELFFKFSRYCDTSKLASISKEAVGLTQQIAEMIIKFNPKNDKDVEKKSMSDPEAAQLYNKVMELEEGYDSIWKGPAANYDTRSGDTSDWEAIERGIISDCESEMKSFKRITFDNLLTIAENNIKNAQNDIKFLESVIKDTNKTISNFEGLINKTTDATSFTIKFLKEGFNCCKQAAEVDVHVLNFVKNTYSKSIKLVTAMSAISEIEL